MRPLIALILVLPLSALADITATRDSGDFTGGIDQIEGDVDPVTLSDWAADLGDFAGQFTQNTGMFSVSLDTADWDRWAHFGDLDGNTGWTIELNIRIDSVGATGGDVGVFDVVSRTNAGSYRAPWFYIRPDGIGVRPGALGTQPPLIAANLNDGQFHTIRMATVAGEAHAIWIDGALAGTWTANDFNSGPTVFLGRNGGNTVDDGTATIDYIRFDTTGAFGPPGSGGSGEVPPPSPGEGDSIDRCQPLYWWPVAGATAYRVWFGSSASLTAGDFQGEFTANYFDPGHLLENTTYHWRVDVMTAGGTVTGTPWSFTTTGGSDLTPLESYQGWKLIHFPTAILLDPAKESTHWGDAADTDGDSLPTMLECAVAGDPFGPDPGKLPKIGFDAGLPVVSFLQRTGATGTPGLDSTAWGLVCRIEAGPDLIGWDHGALWVESAGPPAPNGDGTDTATVRLLNADPARWFTRLSVFEAAP